MNIVLIGFMGSGKTTISKFLAERLNLKLVDMDELVLKISKRENIKQIFALDGETKFRELEAKAAKQLSDIDNSVIATGGGVVMNKIVMDYLKKNSRLVFLDTSFKELHKRLENDQTRPLFQDLEVAKELFDLRQPLYRYYSDLVVKTDDKDPLQLTEAIIKKHSQGNKL